MVKFVSTQPEGAFKSLLLFVLSFLFICIFFLAWSGWVTSHTWLGYGVAMARVAPSRYPLDGYRRLKVVKVLR